MRKPKEKATRQASEARPIKSADAAVASTDYGRLTHLLREEILSGHYEDGDRLKVSEIAGRFGTSTNPAREALQALEGEGLVTIAPNRGASVRAITDDLVHNIFDIRALLEPYIVKSFAEYATPVDLAALSEMQDRCEAAAEADDYPVYHRYNTALHDYITDRHFNDEAINIMKKHHRWMRVLSRRNPMSKSQMRRACDEHRELIVALHSRDIEQVVQATEKHMRNSQQIFLERMRRDRMNHARRMRIGTA